MILSVHMLAGAVIGSRLQGEARPACGAAKLKKYWAVAVLAFLSHFILDAFPHWEYAADFLTATNYDFLIITIKASIDLFIGGAIIHFILRSSNLLRPAMLGAFFGLLPDGFNFIYYLLKMTFGWDIAPLLYSINIHNRLHFADKTDWLLWRVAAEITVSGISLFILWKAHRTPK